MDQDKKWDEDAFEPSFRLGAKKNHPAPSVFHIGGTSVGGDLFSLIAGPCTVESEEGLMEIAFAVKQAGATMLRGGAFKPRTSPYAFPGMGKEGISLLLKAKKETGLPVVTELMELNELSLFDEIDVIQVGARNMQNYAMLRELGKLNKPILLKRGLSSTVEEWLLSAEYILSGGNSRVILCERGIRTFERSTRATLDLSAIPVLKSLSHLPVLVDPSHAAGNAKYVPSLALAAAAGGADGLMIEVHASPADAVCDGVQSLDIGEFSSLSEKVRAILPHRMTF